jgi:RNA polymerase sigma factor (sigma-70 family)
MHEGVSQRVAELFSQHRSALLVIVERRLANELRKQHDAEDILQNAYKAACQAYERYMTQTDRPSAFVWLYGVVMDCLRAQWRQATRQCRDARRNVYLADSSSLDLVPADTGTSPSGAVARSEQMQRVREILALLSNRDQAILLMHVIDRLTFPQIGEVLGMTSSNAAVRCHRAMKRFRDFWHARFSSGGSA